MKQQILFGTAEEFARDCETLPHAKEMVDSLCAITYCKVEVYYHVLEGIIRIPARENKKIGEWNFGFYLSDELLYLIEDQPDIQEIWQELRGKNKADASVGQCLFFLFQELTRDDILYLQHLEKEMGNMEDEWTKEDETSFFQKFLCYRKRLSELHFYYEQMVSVGEVFQSEYAKEGQAELLGNWKQFTDRMDRLHDYVTYLRDYSVQLRDLYHARRSAKQNRVLNLLTVVTSLFFPLTLLTGWYGMNFTYMPEVKWRYGYVMVIVIAVGIIFLEILYVKKKKIP